MQTTNHAFHMALQQCTRTRETQRYGDININYQVWIWILCSVPSRAIISQGPFVCASTWHRISSGSTNPHTHHVLVPVYPRIKPGKDASTLEREGICALPGTSTKHHNHLPSSLLFSAFEKRRRLSISGVLKS